MKYKKVIKKVYVPKYIYPMANVASNFITFLISLLVLAVVMAYYMIFTDTAMRLTPYILLSFVPILILFVLCVGVGMILCTMEVFFKDVEYMYEVFCMLLFYATPIFYNVETLHITNRYAQYALMANPLYSIVSMFRDCVLFGRAMNPNHIIYSAVFSIAMLLIGVLVFYKKQDDFILHIRWEGVIMGNVMVDVNHVSIRFIQNQEKVDNLKEYFIKLVTRKLKYDDFWALTDVNFQIEKGERLGVLGFNGAGKSTLLKTVAGVLKPTKGTVTTKGVIAPLLELGAGFDMNYTGKENVYLYGATMGYSRKYIEVRYDEIVEFAELKDFMHVPVKNYSSGMRARLGFAIATAVDPQVLILDEVLSVGDARFRAKSEKRVMSMFENNVTVLFVSHSTEQVRRLCNKAIILDHGKMIASGTSQEVCDIYDRMVKGIK